MRTVYGPYRGTRNREFVVIIENGVRRSTHYSRYLVEEALGYRLSSDEQVHHRDGNSENNNLSNLEIVSKSSHKERHAAEISVLQCDDCGTQFTRKAAQVRSNSKGKQYAGIFCSLECARIGFFRKGRKGAH